MRVLTRYECTAVGCTNEACVMVNDDLLCLHCAHPDLTNEQLAALQAAEDDYDADEFYRLNNL